MNTEQAVKLCEFWTTTSSAAIGTTSNPEVGAFFNGEEYQRFGWGRRDKVYGWAIKVPRTIKDGPFEIENFAFKMILQEIERRRGSQQEA